MNACLSDDALCSLPARLREAVVVEVAGLCLAFENQPGIDQCFQRPPKARPVHMFRLAEVRVDIIHLGHKLPRP